MAQGYSVNASRSGGFLRKIRLLQHKVGWLFGGVFALTSTAAWAHAGDPGGIGWLSWQFRPAVIIPTLLTCAVYGIGAARGMADNQPSRTGQHIAFIGGIASVFLALVSPIDAMAGHLFYMQQIQTMLLRMIAPTLIVLADPGATLIAGLPRGQYQKIGGALLGGIASRRTVRAFTHTTVVTFLFVAAFALWQLPAFLSRAVFHASSASLMQATMLATGFLFWWRALDLRSPPDGPGYGTRFAMLFFGTLPQIGLGAYLTVKTEVLYPAYDIVGRLFHMSSLADETIGGSIVWVPGSIACVLAAIIIIHLWAKHEERLDARRTTWTGSNSDALLFPTTAAALIEYARPKNRILAIGAAAIALAMFALVMITGVLNHINNTMPPNTIQSNATIWRR